VSRLPPVLAARHVSKSFGGERALDDVDITVEAGEVHGLLGENGSGKSTLLRTLAGYHAPATGAELEVRGNPVGLPLAAGEFRRLGMSFVHQDLALIPSLSVVENLRLGELSTERRLHISWREERRRAKETLARFGIGINPTAPVATLTPAERALLAIVRALEDLPGGGPSGEGGLLALDEPTSYLPETGRRRLFRLIRQVADAGSGVLFVSHDLNEAREVSDRLTVLRDGRRVGTVSAAEVSNADLLEMIVGVPVAAVRPPRRAPTAAGVAASIRGLEGAVAQDVSLELVRGEIVGLTGLAGSGFEEIPYLLFGASPCRSGRLALDGTELDLTVVTPDRALRAGLALLPADRQTQGSVASLPLVDNVTLPTLHRYTKRLRLRRRRMLDDTATLLEDYDVRPRRPKALYRALSGGNQQKAELAKWLSTSPPLLVLDEPTRGVDVGARQQIMKMIRDVAGEGSAVIVSSGDHEQLDALCDRVLVFSGGEVVKELSGTELTREAIARECHGRALRPRAAQ
jgi:ribose transport system ATP-binding protein